jgi:hypothetical protein
MKLPLHKTIAPLRPYHRAVKGHDVVNECRKVWSLMMRSPHWNGIRKSLSSLLNDTNLSGTDVDLHADAISAALPAGVYYE